VIFFSVRSAWLAKAFAGALVDAWDMDISPVCEGLDFT
jgi:hypothetical protein